MHPDASENYATPRLWDDAPPPIATMSDEQVVLELWGNTRYALLTGDRHLTEVTPGLHQFWREVSLVPLGNGRAEAFAVLRQRAEERGWHRVAQLAV